MYHLSSQELVGLFQPREVIEIVTTGIISYAQGRIQVPDRLHFERGPSTNLIMPAFGPEYYCTKLISVDPNNHLYNLPVISGTLILNDNRTGETLMSMDAPMITALRTAAVGSIGMDLIANDHFKRLGVIGLGTQGYWQSWFAASTHNIEEIHCYSRSKEKFEQYRNNLNSQFENIEVIWCSSAEEVVENSEVIFACTTSPKPVFQTTHLNLSDKRFISVGSFRKDMQELPDEVYRSCDALIVDSELAKEEVGDVINTVQNHWIEPSKIYSLAQILNQKIELQEENLVFKSVGMAAFDLALAEAAYKKMTT